MGELADRRQLQGKALLKVTPNEFSTVSAQTLVFHAAAVRSPPLLCQQKSSLVSGIEESIFIVEEYELNGLTNEFLM